MASSFSNMCPPSCLIAAVTVRFSALPIPLSTNHSACCLPPFLPPAAAAAAEEDDAAPEPAPAPAFFCFCCCEVWLLHGKQCRSKGGQNSRGLTAADNKLDALRISLRAASRSPRSR